MKHEIWIDAEFFFRELNTVEEGVLDSLMHASSPYASGVPREFEDDPHQSSTTPGRQSHSSGFGSFLKADMEYRGRLEA